jgi:hypothetical protein
MRRRHGPQLRRRRAASVARRRRRAVAHGGADYAPPTRVARPRWQRRPLPERHRTRYCSRACTHRHPRT